MIKEEYKQRSVNELRCNSCGFWLADLDEFSDELSEVYCSNCSFSYENIIKFFKEIRHNYELNEDGDGYIHTYHCKNEDVCDIHKMLEEMGEI